MIGRIKPSSLIIFLYFTSAMFQNAIAQESCPFPSDTLPEFTLAIEAKDAGKDDEAIAYMESLLVEFKGSPAPYYILGNWYWESGKKEDARKMWKEARTAAPG